jgi:hypothetical protein
MTTQKTPDDETVWTDVVEGLPWLMPLREIPSTGMAPRFMTACHPRAVGSYGPQFCAWADSQAGLHPRRTEGLRWHQRLIAYRLLEHDAAGALVWRNALVTLARQLGKSWLVRALIIWRIQNRELFGDEEQTITHMAHKLITAQEVWRPASRWARLQGDWTVRTANGEQQVESPDGGRWLVRAATDGVGVGFALSALVVDEGWRIARSIVEAADPALSESESPQLLLISTAGDSDSDLFATYRDKALAELTDPTNTLILEWSARQEMAVDDREAWRMASPYWTEKREAEVIDKLHKLELLEFKQNYLNQWIPLARGRTLPGEKVFDEVAWANANGYVPAGHPVVGAVESWYGEGCAVALAEKLDDDQVGISVHALGSLAEAGELLAQHAPTMSVIMCGKSLLPDPAFKGLNLTGAVMGSKQAVTRLKQLVDEDAMVHDGSEALSEQALEVRVDNGPEGPRIRSSGRLDAVKATVWAANAARAAVEVPQIW